MLKNCSIDSLPSENNSLVLVPRVNKQYKSINIHFNTFYIVNYITNYTQKTSC